MDPSEAGTKEALSYGDIGEKKGSVVKPSGITAERQVQWGCHSRAQKQRITRARSDGTANMVSAVGFCGKPR